MISVILSAKKKICVISITALIIAAIFAPVGKVFAEEEKLFENAGSESIPGVSYIIYECDTKQTLMRQNIDSQADCSVLARLMTCLLVLENPAISVTDYISPSADSTSKSGRHSIFASNQYMVDHLIKAVVLCNADNAARTLAEAYNPNTEYFITLMNQKAISLGMKNTFFSNVDGTNDGLQRTTAYDMAIFMAYAMNNMQFRNIASNPAAHIWGGIAVLNECQMVSNDSITNAAFTAGATGIYNSENGLTTVMFYLVSKQTSSVPPVKLVMILSGLSNSFIHKTGINYINNIFTTFKKTALISKSNYIAKTEIGGNELLIVAGETCYCMMPSDVTNYVETVSLNVINQNNSASVPDKIFSLDDLEAPIQEGLILGSANFLLKDGSVHSVRIMAGNSVHSDSRTINLFYRTVKENTDIFILISVLIIFEIILLFGFIFSKLRKRF